MTLTDFINLVSSELPILVEFWDSGGHSDGIGVDDIRWNDECWRKQVQNIKITETEVYIKLS